MSGGSLDYVYSRVEDAAMQAAARAETALHRAFANHLHKVAKALKDLEWMLSCDTSPGDEEASIRAVLHEGSEIEEATKQARKALADLEAALSANAALSGCRAGNAWLQDVASPAVRLNA